MKKTLIAGLIAVGSGALALPVHAGISQAAAAQPAVLVAQAAHDHGSAGHAGNVQGSAHNTNNAKVSSTVAVSGCWIRSMPAPAPSGGYFVVKNSSDKDVKLQSASSADYGMVMLHQTMQKDGMSKMAPTHDVVVPAAGQLEFKPGGYHAMLEKPGKTPVIGSKVVMDFMFDTGEKASAECEVKAANTKVPMSHH